MSKIEFSKDEKDVICAEIKQYVREELDQDIGLIQAQFLLDFFTEKVGPAYYNRGLHDALALFEKQVENVADAIYEIEQPEELGRHRGS